MRQAIRASIVLVTASACAASATPPPASPPVAAPPAVIAPPPSPPRAPAKPVVLSPGVVLIGEVMAPPQFDPKPPLQALKPELLRCYNEARLLAPDLHGKLTLQIQVSGEGAVTLTTAAPGGTLNDTGLLACISDAAKGITFPKPGGVATVSVPVVFRP